VNEERIRTLLQRADSAAGKPAFGHIDSAGIRRRIRRRRIVRTATSLAAAAGIILAIALPAIRTQAPSPQPEPQRVASLEEQVQQLQAQADATLRLVQEVLEQDRQERRLAGLRAELASIPDPLQEIEKQVDKAAFLLIYQADRLYLELNQSESAVATYKEVIQLFPTNRWAEVARERLSQIEQRQFNKSGDKGDTKCEPRNA
jgi:tetratricopeptide (TPR) repeat protein